MMQHVGRLLIPHAWTAWTHDGRRYRRVHQRIEIEVRTLRALRWCRV